MQLLCWRGRARASVWIATLLACLLVDVSVRCAVAQESALSFKECLDKQKELRDQAHSYGDLAWEAAGAYMKTVDAFRTGHWMNEEAKALYDKADELRSAADAIHCVSHLGTTPVTDAEKFKQFEDMDRILRDNAILDPNIRDFVNSRFKQIDDANEATFKLLGDTAMAIRDNPALGMESNSNLHTLGDSQTLGNSNSLGNYSAALEQDIRTYNAQQARNNSIEAEGKRLDADAAARQEKEAAAEQQARARERRRQLDSPKASAEEQDNSRDCDPNYRYCQGGRMVPDACAPSYVKAMAGQPCYSGQ